MDNISLIIKKDIHGIVLVICCFTISCVSTHGAHTLWKMLENEEVEALLSKSDLEVPNEYEMYHFQTGLIKKALRKAGNNHNQAVLLALPGPYQEPCIFKIWKSGIVPEAIEKKHPSLISYKGHCIADGSTKIRLNITQSGLRAMVTSSKDTWFISPMDKRGIVIVYKKSDLPPANHFLENKAF